MLHLPESPFEHHILEVIRTIKHRHLDLQALLHAKMSRLPCHFSIKAKQSGYDSGDGTLTCMLCRVLMRINTPRQIKNPFSWRRDHGLEGDNGHSLMSINRRVTATAELAD